MKTQQNKNKKGYSLVEVLFTLMILSIGLAGTAVLMTGNIKNSIKAKNQVIAAGLAQEGVELVKNIKDNDPTAFAAFAGYYIIDASAGLVPKLASCPSCILYQDATGIYSHNAVGTVSKFYRRVFVGTDVVTGNRFVIANVIWDYVNHDFLADCNIANSCISVTAILP